MPFAGLMARPAGRPVADHEAMVTVDELSETPGTNVTGVPVTLDWVPGEATVTELTTDQVNDHCPAKPALSVAVSMTVEVPPVEGVPVMVPLDELIVTPAGSPTADQVKVGTGLVWLSVADDVRLTVMPLVPDWFDGPATDTVSTTCQVNIVDPEKPRGSVAVTSTG